MGQKTDHFKKFITALYDDLGRLSICQNVYLFIRSETSILNVATVKYALRKFRKAYYTEDNNLLYVQLLCTIPSKLTINAKYEQL